ncbi:hypothetical protein CYMTET_11777 [Cymbomonas tetramitiformis]|uniref:Uncharacterized protein n=1 Tax=Cymbomonas tetramitiformis TaxID=36881 RepID=A0AAE0GLX1_9CHLO|nr:hypothetical protein CYMTET_11777 [Cymbomonas tetramitiformis]
MILKNSCSRPLEMHHVRSRQLRAGVTGARGATATTRTLRSKTRAVASALLLRPEWRGHLKPKSFLRAVEAADVAPELPGKRVRDAFLAAADDDDQAAEAVFRAVINSMIGPASKHLPRIGEMRGSNDEDELMAELRRLKEACSGTRRAPASPPPLMVLIVDLNGVFGETLGLVILRMACRMTYLESVRVQARMPLCRLFCDNTRTGSFLDESELEEMAVRRKDAAAAINVGDLHERLDDALTAAEKAFKHSRDEAIGLLQDVICDVQTRGDGLPEKVVKPAMKAISMHAFLHMPLEALGGLLDSDQLDRLLVAQCDAAYLAWLAGGWRASPDARLIRGFASLVRGQVAEAVRDVSSAVSSDHDWALSELKKVASTILSQARQGLPPCFGVWRRCEANVERLPSPRIAPAYCQAEGCMYVFGGVRPDSTFGIGNLSSSYLSIINVTLGVITPEGPTSDLWRYTFGDNRWTLLQSKGASPPPRGFGLLTYNDGALYLHGGRVTWSSAPDPYDDVWRFVLSEERWEPIAGHHPSLRSAGPHGVHENGWCIFDPDKGEPRLRRFDFELAEWSILAPTSPVPRVDTDLASASGWLTEGSLWVFMVEADTDIDTHNKETRLWEVKLSRDSCSWQAHTLAGRSTTSPRFEGSLPTPCAESSACFDPESRKGYIFGGWTHDLLSFAAQPDGTLCQLTGRYFSVVVEVDVDAHVIRAIEPALAGSGGPNPRGYAGIGACSGKLTVFGGYTTFSKTKGIFSQVKTCTDYWECRLINADEAMLADPMHSLNKNMATLTTVNFFDVYESLRVAVLRDMTLRKIISDECEPRPGALVGVMHGSDCSPLSEGEFYAPGHLRWMPRDAILERLPGLQQWEPDVYKDLHRIDTQSRATLLFLADFREQPVPSQLPYQAWLGWFGRWHPNGIYISEHALAKGELKLSAEETAPPENADLFEVRGVRKILAATVGTLAHDHPSGHLPLIGFVFRSAVERKNTHV